MRRPAAIVALLATVTMSWGASAASADFGLKDLGVAFTNEDGSAAVLPGTHPFAFTTTLGVSTEVGGGGEVPQGEIKTLLVAQPEGLVGMPAATPRCSSAAFNTRVEGRPQCPDSSAIGVAAVKAEFTALPPGTDLYLHVPVYNLQPPFGQPAQFGFVALNVPVVVDANVNPDRPHNIVASLRNTPQAILFYGSRLTLWGNPANPAHDPLRGNCVGEPVELTTEAVSLGDCPVDSEEKPFLTLPRSCQGPLVTTFSANTWANPGVFAGGSASSQEMVGCEALEFGPTATARPTAERAESATGMDLTIEVDDPELTASGGTARSDVRKVEVVLPEGMTANPSAAEGLGACAPAQYDGATVGNAGCPESSKLGTVSVTTPLLEESLRGEVFLAEPFENEFGSLIALYVVIRSPQYGIVVTLAGKVETTATGRLITTFADAPQLPFSRFDVHLRQGPRAPLTTPSGCGEHEVLVRMTPWSGGPAVESTASFAIGSGPGGGPCASGGVPPFNPGFTAGSLNNNAGSYAPFFIRLTRNDGDQEITRFDAVLPAGVLPKLAGVPQCPYAAIAAARSKAGRAELSSPSCPAASQIGRVEAGAGVGEALTWVGGKVYLAGPYAGAPLSVVAIAPAVAGPFDVGTVVVREAIDVNPASAVGEVDSTTSDLIPHILAGIPLRLRDLRVYVDHPEFMRNPTSCAERQTLASVFGSAANPFLPADDLPVPRGARYQAASCAGLKFKPSLNLKLSGQMKRSGNPALTAVLAPRPGDANLRGTSVLLPRTQLVDQFHINNPCTRVQYRADECPAGSVIGTVKAWTPLLDQPLAGNIYFRSNGGDRELPDLVLDLRGQFRIEQVGFVDSRHGRIRTRFTQIPDAPISRVVLKLFGGERGLLENSADLCARKRKARLTLVGQNGRQTAGDSAIRTSCQTSGRSSR